MYNLELQYVPAEQIINEVKNTMRTYFEAGLIDESHLYPVIKYCLTKMGLKIYPTKQEVLTVENYKTKLPRDFYKVVSAVGCGKFIRTDFAPEGPHVVERDVIEIPVCKSEWDYCKDSCGNLYEIVQQFPTHTVQYTDVFKLTFTKGDAPYCMDGCFFPGQQHAEVITIKNGYIHTGFDSGSIYLEYLTNLKDNHDDFLLPDQETILVWVKNELITEILRILYLNGYADVERRYLQSLQTLAVSQVNAESVYKRAEMGDFYNLRKTLYSRFKKFKTGVYGNTYLYVDEPVSIHNPYRKYK